MYGTCFWTPRDELKFETQQILVWEFLLNYNVKKVKQACTVVLNTARWTEVWDPADISLRVSPEL